MADPSELPEPDAVEGVPHPRHAQRVFGHEEAEAAFLDAFNSGRLHHAWLISGPRGIGKATLAWRMAAFLLAQPTEPAPGLFGEPEPLTSLDIDPDSPLRHRIAALSESRLMLLRRGPNDKGDQLETQITAKPVRALKEFFHLSSTDGGRRVVIVDPADEMNPTAANALLKELEEPPKATTFLIVCHQPHQLLPTIRSRCRSLRLGPLAPEALTAALDQAGAVPPEDSATLASLAAGSAGAAVRLVNLGGLDLWASLLELMKGAPGIDRPAAIKFCEGFAGRAKEPQFDLVLTLIDLFLSRLARAGVDPDQARAATEAEAALLARLAPDPRAGRGWAALQQELSARARHGKAVNLDPGSLILDTLLRIDEAASTLALR
ncbi:DNA polymerase III subunit delta' [Frigidibacter sp. ROC022]|uniref:DNA polymerase III subunit delta' n=1 Tax=Frigidibacter sp. ROC022 TaxID=2971796 RepID=UPI00215AD303|nr:DNA polymerase III subunit delta' [Frigidibacter sp. ROC022]MCR8723091.1 DNA polymerase III subunit delta' [Frigidibacter sp. ROC022]